MKSYIVVSVSGSHNEKFVNEILKKNIKVWEIKNKDGVIYFNTSPYFYRKLAQAALGSGVRTRVEERHGAYFRLRKYKKRYGIFLGLGGFFGVIVLLSNFVWDVRVSGNADVTSAQILEIMERHGIVSGVFAGNYDKEKAELAAIIELDRLAWVSVERTGSRVNVKVSERLETVAVEIPHTTPCNIIAAKTGVIRKTEVYRGTLLYEIGSGVNRGDVIVSGVVEDGTNNVILSHASAKIIAECEDKAEFFVPFISSERRNTGKVTENNFIIFLGKSFPLFIFPSVPEHASHREEFRAPTFFGLRLPHRLRTDVYTHYEMVDVQIGQTAAIERLKKQIEQYKTNFYGVDSGNEIISYDERFIIKENGIAAEVKFVYLTDIAVKRVIGVP
jgi:similar to stage IV sporulation protein